jgi:hypothetical protein
VSLISNSGGTITCHCLVDLHDVVHKDSLDRQFA